MSRQKLLIGMNGMLVLAVLAVATAHPTASDKVLVLSPQWLGYRAAFEVVSHADGSIVAASLSDDVAVGFSTDPHFVRKLYGAGAMLVLRAPGVTPCLNSSTRADS